MNLRRLELKDAIFMLEWMHDTSVVKDLKNDFAHKTVDDCVRFIENSWIDNNNLNLAITDEMDEYLGTVTLRNIHDNAAEFAIAIRSKAMGQGVSAKAMKSIINIGFNEKKLLLIYWCVSPNNIRAIRFYEKNGYKRISSELLNITSSYTEDEIKNYYWYCVKK